MAATPDVRPVGDLPTEIGRTAARELVRHGVAALLLDGDWTVPRRPGVDRARARNPLPGGKTMEAEMLRLAARWFRAGAASSWRGLDPCYASCTGSGTSSPISSGTNRVAAMAPCSSRKDTSSRQCSARA